MTTQELESKYLNIPNELKIAKRWVCYKIENKDNKVNKIPMSPFGSFASTTDPNTWSSFKNACLGCEKFNYDGLGFILGEDKINGTSFFGIDIDNHPDEKGNYMPKEQFKKIAIEFIETLKSYTELSYSGKGIHIICKGTIPKGANRKSGCPIEMYDKARFFVMTGRKYGNYSVNERTNEIVPLWQKYLSNGLESGKNNASQVKGISIEGKKVTFGGGNFYEGEVISQKTSLSDEELFNKIKISNDNCFFKLYNGDMSDYDNDHSAADLALAIKLAFWTGGDSDRIDSLFRKSALYREKWDRKWGETTYGAKLIEKALSCCTDFYHSYQKKDKLVYCEDNIPNIKEIPTKINDKNNQFLELRDEIRSGENIKVKKVFKSYTIDDSGNAERFYDQFGELFHYNITSKCWMFWNGMNWETDTKDLIRKYADQLVNLMRQEAKEYDEKILEAKSIEGNEENTKDLEKLQKSLFDNVKRVANKAGKDAMLSELQHLKDIPIDEEELDSQGTYLNTLSGTVDLKTGEIKPFNRKDLISKNTNCEISFESPQLWLKTLHDIFECDTEEETQEMMECYQIAVGYSLSDSTREQVMFLLNGNGSNGKSLVTEQIANMMGQYAMVADSSLLVANNSSAQSNQFALAALKGKRLVTTSETEEGQRFSEARVKSMTGDSKVQAQYKYGSTFEFEQTHKIWLATNSKPNIRGTDLGIWRRIYLFDFVHTFTGEKKDVDLPQKLKKETSKILGWAVKGFIKYLQKGLTKTKTMQNAVDNYRESQNVITTYLKDNCAQISGYRSKANTLYQNFKTWAINNNEYAMPQSKFSEELKKRGFERIRQSDGLYYVGIKLNEDYKGIKFDNTFEN